MITLSEIRDLRAATDVLRAWFDGFEAAHAGRGDPPMAPEALLDLSTRLARMERKALLAEAAAEEKRPDRVVHIPLGSRAGS